LIDYAEIKEFDPESPNENLSVAWVELSEKALISREVEFTEFDLYLEEET
jgi:hypothetical protein